MILNEKGISLVESLVAVMLTGVAIIGLLTMQPLSWQSASKADSISHAVGIMQRQLEDVECSIMAGNIPSNNTYSLSIGSETFTISTTITAQTKRWLVRVNVSGKGLKKAVNGSLIVTRQNAFS
jgi:Tfp pilus assembly protein PilV